MRQILTWFLNTIMEYEAQLQTGAMHYERTSSRKAHRKVMHNNCCENEINPVP